MDFDKLKKFYYSFSLYQNFKIDDPSFFNSFLPAPPLNLFCNECNIVQTFNSEDHNKYLKELSAKKSSINIPGQYPVIKPKYNPNQIININYVCAACQSSFYYYYIKISDDLKSFQKIGQAPPIRIEPNTNLSKIFKEHLDLYKNGLMCESQSYGIAALAYYRRIIENYVDKLIELIKTIIPEQELTDYLKKIDEIKHQKNADVKIKLIKDILPDALKPNNYNPLGIIYDALSAGIHQSSDEECLKLAKEINQSLIFLIDNISTINKNNSQFTQSMKSLINKKSNP